VRALALALVILSGLTALPARAGDFTNWAAIVIAGDWRSHSGGDSDAFDNARRDVAKALVQAGFSPANVVQFSLRPQRPGDAPGLVVDARTAINAFEAATARAPDGCLFYLTSHGSPDGAVFGPGMILTPTLLGRTLDDVCAGRPTVVVISACFSGVFAPAAGAPERMILTAARADRTSFGCGDKDKYPYFDACVLKSLPESATFLNLAERARACVEARETAEHLEPHSEPQTWLGAQARMTLPLEVLGRP
jgi:hypothetical protein